MAVAGELLRESHRTAGLLADDLVRRHFEAVEETVEHRGQRRRDDSLKPHAQAVRVVVHYHTLRTTEIDQHPADHAGREDFGLKTGAVFDGEIRDEGYGR